MAAPQSGCAAVMPLKECRSPTRGGRELLVWARRHSVWPSTVIPAKSGPLLLAADAMLARPKDSAAAWVFGATEAGRASIDDT